MSGLMKIYDYRQLNVTLMDSTTYSAKIRVGSALPSFVTALIIVDGQIVDFKHSDEPLQGGSIDIEVPVIYRDKPYSVFVFSSKNGYSNKDIGRTVWGVWIKEMIESHIVEVGEPSKRIEGSVMLVVPITGAGFDIIFTRLNDSSAAHADIYQTGVAIL